VLSLVRDLIYSIGQIRSEFPHYDELDQIWRGIPGFDSDLISSDPHVNHAQHLLSLVQIGPSKKTSTSVPSVSAREEDDMDVEDRPQDDTNHDDETADLTGLGDIDDGLEHNLFDGDMQVDDGGTWQFISPEVARLRDDSELPVIQVDDTSVAGIPQPEVSIKHVGYRLRIKRSL
jgi:hypothetical protein